MRSTLFATLIFSGAILFTLACQNSLTNEPSTTQPRAQVRGEQSETERNPTNEKESASTDYSAERYRIVNRPDEIVSVLYNGATVIAKRVPSPACAVRAYTYTGGVYEGKWLGGGLSHLLEHLVAGGSNGRRTERQNLDLLQAIGNNSNAYTTDDHTSFYVITTLPHMEQAVDMVTGWMLTASITAAEYRREYE